MVGRSFRRSGISLEAQQEVRERLGGPPRGPGEDGSPNRKSVRGRETHSEDQEGQETHLEV